MMITCPHCGELIDEHEIEAESEQTMDNQYRYHNPATVYQSLRDRLHSASPTSEGHTAEPFDINEIDAHPDAARIWATVLVLRGER